MKTYNFLNRWLNTTNAKDIGTLYILFGTFAGIMGIYYSVLIRMELAHSGSTFFHGTYQLYNVVETLYTFIMIFFMLMPILINGFGCWLVPFFLKVPNLSFPRLNNISFWLLPISFSFLILASIIDLRLGTGWTIQSFLSSMLVRSDFVVFLKNFSVYVLLLSFMFSAFNFTVTILYLRPSDMGFLKMPLYLWSILITSVLLLLFLPLLALKFFIFWNTHNLGSFFFYFTGELDLIFYRRFFWLFSNAGVCFLIVPSFGIISTVFIKFSQKDIFETFRLFLICTLIIFLGFIAWTEYIFTFGLDGKSVAYFTTIMLIILFTFVIEICHWISRFWNENIILKTSLFFTFGFLVLFILCSITGVILINASLKNTLSVNSYIVYTFYYTLLMSFVFAMFSAFYGCLSPQCHFKEWYGIVHFITLFTGANLMFFSYYFLGLFGMPGLINEHPAVFEFWNVFDSLGFSISLISTIWFFYIVFKILSNKYFL